MIIDVDMDFSTVIPHNSFIPKGARLELDNQFSNSDPYFSWVLVKFPSSPATYAFVDNVYLMNLTYCMQYSPNGGRIPVTGLKWNPKSPVITVLATELLDKTLNSVICECGKEKHGFANHSTWCGAYAS